MGPTQRQLSNGICYAFRALSDLPTNRFGITATLAELTFRLTSWATCTMIYVPTLWHLLGGATAGGGGGGGSGGTSGGGGGGGGGGGDTRVATSEQLRESLGFRSAGT